MLNKLGERGLQQELFRQVNPSGPLAAQSAVCRRAAGCQYGLSWQPSAAQREGYGPLKRKMMLSLNLNQVDSSAWLGCWELRLDWTEQLRLDDWFRGTEPDTEIALPSPCAFPP